MRSKSPPLPFVLDDEVEDRDQRADQRRCCSGHERLSDAATFTTMEDWLRIHIEGNGKGHFRAQCQAVDQPGLGHRLTFSIEFDQTELPAIVRGLDDVCAAFPVVGTPRGS